MDGCNSATNPVWNQVGVIHWRSVMVDANIIKSSKISPDLESIILEALIVIFQ